MHRTAFRHHIARRTVRAKPLHLLLFLLPSLFLLSCGTPAAAPTVPTVQVVTITPTPTSTPRPTATPTPTLTPSPTPDPTAFLQEIRANELGWVLVLEYHLIEEPEARWARTPANFRADIERLIAENYYPINLADLATGNIDVPAGKTPVVLTFDDSSAGQFRYLADGTVDPNCAVGILLDAAKRHPDDWRPRASFYVLLDVDAPDHVLFGQPEFAEKKLRDLVGWGMEVGTHTISHFNLAKGTVDEDHWQLAVAVTTIEGMIPGYKVRTLSVPLGEYPADETVLKSGEWEGKTYTLLGAAEVSGGPSPSPFSSHFDPYHIRRNQAIQEEVDTWLAFFQDHPELRYVSDGDVMTASIPDPLPERLQGILRTDLPAGVTVRQYPATQQP